MSAVVLEAAKNEHSSHVPRLRLVPDGEQSAPPILIAGRDASRRAAVLEDFSSTLPQGTRFEQAGTLWEVLIRAPASRMVILSGELDDVPTASAMHTLGHRHPGLPVVSLGRSPLCAAGA